jgi:hypothetical protein
MRPGVRLCGVKAQCGTEPPDRGGVAVSARVWGAVLSEGGMTSHRCCATLRTTFCALLRGRRGAYADTPPFGTLGVSSENGIPEG